MIRLRTQFYSLTMTAEKLLEQGMEHDLAFKKIRNELWPKTRDKAIELIRKYEQYPNFVVQDTPECKAVFFETQNEALYRKLGDLTDGLLEECGNTRAEYRSIIDSVHSLPSPHSPELT